MIPIIIRGKVIHIHLNYKVDNQNDLLKVNLAEGKITVRLETGNRVTLSLQQVKGYLALTQTTHGRLIEDEKGKIFFTDYYP